MFEDYYFDRHTAVEFRLYQMLKTAPIQGLTINRMSELMSLSYQQTYNAYQNVVKHLLAMQPALQPPKGKRTKPDMETLSENVHLEHFRFFLLNQSLAFQFYNACFQNDGVDVSSFCTEHKVSLSTLRRRLDPYRTFLRSKGINFDGASWQPLGNEMVIRFMLVAFFREGFRGAPWPFTAISEEEAQKIFLVINQADFMGVDHAQALTRRNLNKIAIIKMRLCQGHPVSPNRRLGQIIDLKPTESIAPFTPDYFPGVHQRILNIERGFYHFVRLSKLNVDDFDTQARQDLRATMAKNDMPVSGIVSYLHSQLTEGLEPSDALAVRTNPSLLTNLYRLCITYYVIDGDFVQETDFALSPEVFYGGLPVYQHLTKLMAEIPDDAPYALFKAYLPEFAKAVFEILVPILSLFETQPLLNVAVELEQYDTVTSDMLHFLEDISIIHLLPGLESRNADVIITSAPHIVQMSQEMRLKDSDTVPPAIVYWGAHNQDSDLSRLLRGLADLAATKLPHGMNELSNFS